jgi:hypothetical protein
MQAEHSIPSTTRREEDVILIPPDEIKLLEGEMLDEFHQNLLRHREAMRKLRIIRNNVRRIEHENVTCGILVFVIVFAVLLYSLTRSPR